LVAIKKKSFFGEERLDDVAGLVNSYKFARNRSLTTCRIRFGSPVVAQLLLLLHQEKHILYYELAAGFYLLHLKNRISPLGSYSMAPQFQLLTKPSYRCIFTARQLQLDSSKAWNQYSYISTSEGIMNVKAAIEKNLGGELLIRVIYK
jgi:ribosomal protein S8